MSGIGQKLGGILGGLGAGLSFIPGVGTAVGAALSAAGGIAGSVGGAVDEKKRREEEERLRREQEQQANPAMNPMQAGNERPQQAQIDNTLPATPQPPQRNVFTPAGNQGMQGGYQNQLNESIIPSMILGGNDPFGGP